MSPEQWNNMTDQEKLHYMKNISEIVNRRLNPMSLDKVKSAPSIPKMLAVSLFIFPAIALYTQNLDWLWGAAITIVLGIAAYFPSKHDSF